MLLCRLAFFFCTTCIMANFASLYADKDIADVVNEIELKKVQEVSGTVSQVDSIGSTITINGLTNRGNNEEMRLKVPDDAKITQGAEDIKLTDINVGDSITVRYRINPDTKELQVINIVDNNIGNNQM